MDIQRDITVAWRHFSETPVVYIVAGAAATLLTALTFGLVAGPLIGGFVHMAIVHQRDGRRPVLSDMVYGFQEFGRLISFFLTVALVVLGFFLLFIPGVIFSTWWIYALVIMVDRKTDFIEAMRASKARVQEKGFFLHLGFIVLVFVLPPLVTHAMAAVFMPFWLLNLFVCPLQILALVSAYLHG